MKKYLLIAFMSMNIFLSKGQDYGKIENLDKKNGFKTIVLGDSITNFEKYKLLGSRGFNNFYDVNGEDLNIGDNPIRSIAVTTFEGRISKIIILFDKEVGYKIREVLFQAYGLFTNRPNRFMDKYEWEGSEVELNLDYDSTSNEGMMLLSSKKISKLERDFEDKKNKESINDL